MKIIKLAFTLSLMLLLGCGQNGKMNENDLEQTASENVELEDNPKPVSEKSNVEDETVVLQQVFDTKANKLMASMPLPANWNISKRGKTLYDGPNGIGVYFFPMKSYVYNSDPQMQQLYQQSGQKMRRFISIEELITEDILPIARKEGSKLLKIYLVPDVAAADKEMDAMMYKAMPSQQIFRAAVSEWLDAKGKKYALITHQNCAITEYMTTWSYFSHALDVPNGDYEKAKNTLIYALANTKYNPRYFDEYNQKEAQLSSASWAAHNSKMQQNQRNFDSWQKNHVQKTEAMNNASMAAYRSRDEASDRNQNRFVNYIKDENTVTETSTGKRYQVETGGTQYWINSDGEYVKSDNPNYDPNRDQNINNKKWEETQITD